MGHWYFTSPWEPVLVRRGDPLGLRAGADHFADFLAPGLNNGISDARWISLLSWCLQRSHEAWHKAGGSGLSRRDDQRARYAWLRPLELLWVARTLQAEGTGQLRGKRSIQRWLRGGAKEPNFGMSEDRFRQYRQIGTYGAYRVIFRHSPLLTGGDGWTPAQAALKLAGFVHDQLPATARPDPQKRAQWRIWRDDQARYWTTQGWSNWAKDAGTGLLPTRKGHRGRKLEEHGLLKPVLFGTGSVRLATAWALARAKAPQTHLDLCHALAQDEALKEFKGAESLALLPSFSALADAAMEAMRRLWHQFNQHGEQQTPAIGPVARCDALQSSLEQLARAGRAWLREPAREHFPQAQVADRLAATCAPSSSAEGRLRALAAHHREFGGGRRWFDVQDGKFIPLIRNTGIAASEYRFRLRSVAVLAAQCGIAGMEQAVGVLDQETAGDADDEEEDGE